MTNGSFLPSCPKEPNRENCGLAAAKWLIQKELIYIDFPEPDAFDDLAKSAGEVLGVAWDEERAGEVLKLTDRTGVPFPAARFVCRNCTHDISVEFGPFNAVDINLFDNQHLSR